MNMRRVPPTLIVPGLMLAALQAIVPTGDAVAAGLPKDPCSLLTPAEVQTLAPGAQIGSGKADASMAPLGTSCTFTWGPRTSAWGEPSLTVTVIDGSQAWPGMSADLLRQGLVGKVKAGGPNDSMVSGIGDAAAFTFEERSSNAMVEAYVSAKGSHVAVEYHAGNSLASKDTLISLLKSAVSRL